MSDYIKKYEDIFENVDNSDPYGEESTEQLTPGSLEYKGDIVPFLKNLENAEISRLIDEMTSSDDLDERMDIADRILKVIDNEFQEIYDQVEGDIRDLAIS